MNTAQIGTIDNPFKLTVKQNPYKKDKWDIRVVEAIDKYQAGEILCTSKYKFYCQHHFLIGDKSNIEKLPDVIEITTYKAKVNPSDPDEIESVLVFDRNAPKVRKVGGGRKKKQQTPAPVIQQTTNTGPVVSSNPWAAMLGQAFATNNVNDEQIEEQSVEQHSLK